MPRLTDTSEKPFYLNKRKRFPYIKASNNKNLEKSRSEDEGYRYLSFKGLYLGNSKSPFPEMHVCGGDLEFGDKIHLLPTSNWVSNGIYLPLGLLDDLDGKKFKKKINTGSIDQLRRSLKPSMMPENGRKLKPKIYTNAAWSEATNTAAGLACIFTDWPGRTLYKISAKEDFIAEGLALRTALLQASELGMSKLSLKSDVQNLIRAIKELFGILHDFMISMSLIVPFPQFFSTLSLEKTISLQTV
ncbi:hypothetical protein HID58_032608 [Brassica napus]|uniref:RNase H type-1 domain-containing protein n=1 Tax=Brassica napus TaxID=3708 RepID=A0ABQ8BWT1_BRANA|nr:hypothetical protein HID58_032608 [Brassica napus]